MSERVSMPALGESVTEGTVTRWLKSVGDDVEVDEPLLEVSTDKVDTEIPSPVAGTLQEILAQEDETVEVGADLAVIGDGDGDGSEGDGGESAEGDPADEEQDSDETAEEEQDSGETQESTPQETADEAQESADEAVSQDSSAGESEQTGSASDDGSAQGQTVTMPALGESVTEGTVTRWLKSEGDEVEVDEPLLEVSTDKVDTEIPSPVAGVLTSILVSEDDTVEVGGELAVIGGSSGGSGSQSQDSDKAEEPSESSEGDDADTGDEETGDADTAEEETDATDTADEDDDLASEQQTQDAAAEEAEDKTSGEGDAESEGGGEPEDSGEPTDSGEPEKPAASAKQDKGEQPEASSEQSPDSAEADRDVSAYVTPLVRKLAAQHDVDLTSLEGSGVGGRIRKQDVLEAAKKASDKPADTEPEVASGGAPSESKDSGGAAAPEVSAKRGQTEKMSRLRKVIATRMVESLQVSAQLTTVVEVDVTKVASLRAAQKQAFQEREGAKLSFMPFFALAAVEALKAHPSVNASLDGDQVVYHAQENLGVAVDTERGLLVPVIKDAGDLNIAGLNRKIADLAERTRTNKIGPDELGGGTFTLTNTGSRGALFDTPILNQPQVGILGTGSVVRRPVVVLDDEGGETIGIRSMVYLALTYDHRLVDGADAARFLETVKHRLEEANFEV